MKFPKLPDWLVYSAAVGALLTLHEERRRAARGEFAAEYACPVAKPCFTQRHRANDECGSLRACVAAAANQKRQKEHQHQIGLDDVLKMSNTCAGK